VRGLGSTKRMTGEEKEKLDAHPGRETCTFEGAELSTLKLGLETTFREKLEWLEEVETLFLRKQESRGSRSSVNLSLNDAPPPD
jgi:hypothetical protein